MSKYLSVELEPRAALAVMQRFLNSPRFRRTIYLLVAVADRSAMCICKVVMIS